MVSEAPIRSDWKFPNASDQEPTGHLSPNQVNEFRDCPACYYANRVLHIPRNDTIHYAIGGGCHKVAELIGRRIIEGKDWSTEEALTACEEEFDSRTTVPVDDESGTELIIDLGKYEAVGEAKDSTIKFARVLLDHLPKLFRDRGLIAVEWNLNEMPSELVARAYPFPVEGKLDHVYGDAEGGVSGLTDLKTASKRGGPDENGAVQFAMYGLPAHLAGDDWQIGADILIKTVTPAFETYWAKDGDGNATGYIPAAKYEVVRNLVLDVANRICAGDFPIGKGWNGKHNYDHGLPSFSVAASWPT